MDDLAGKVAVITGGAAGIGRAVAHRFATEGMKVMLADVEEEVLAGTEAALRDEFGAENVAARRVDVRHAEELEALAEATFDRFGTAHLVCNNAGVGSGGMSWEIPDDRWRWIVDVNLMGVVNGIRAFVPRLVEQGEGHVVNTASAAGMLTGPYMSPYYATKHAVVALSESLQMDLELVESPVRVSVLCPEWVRTGIARSERNRPEGVTPSPVAHVLADGADGDGEDAAAALDGGQAGAAGGDGEPGPDGGQRSRPAAVVQGLVDGGIEPDEVADQVHEAVVGGRFWVLTHPTTLPAVRKRWQAIESDGTPVPWGL